jgi:hypothetical protein
VLGWAIAVELNRAGACVHAIGRSVLGLTHELREHPVAAVGVTPGWLRSEKMLHGFGVREGNWRDALTRVPGCDLGVAEHVGRGPAALPDGLPRRC